MFKNGFGVDIFMKKEPKVAIIIVTLNSGEFIKNCLDSIKKETDYKNYRVVVSDNGSTDGTVELMKKKYRWVDLIENKKNIYWAGGNNNGILYSIKKYNPNYFFLLNDDTIVKEKNWLKQIIETGESNKKIGIIGPKLVYPDGTPQHYGGYMSGFLMTNERDDKEKIKEVDHIMGSAIMIKKEVIEKIGLIDDVFTPYLLDETDYCLRAKKVGFKVVSDRNVEIVHYKSQTIEKRNKELKIMYVRGKNDSIFSLINLKFPYSFIRTFLYIPLILFLKKKDEKKEISLKNIKFRGDFFRYFLILIRVEFFILRNIKMIIKKREDRKLNNKIWPS
jgi:hypothetical protein